ncbi:uncharacterized protein K452DRAFT_289505 [Aplosporella prunicola CBS 121167]|uniref:Geranylgeranyl pyrophosphate synthetase n=1 Tax=Aplosporella prunicola CBS 121167 TaxID=1176127 RepID=A0A6A6B5T4_9PEZI|nr:uncharacterized protein K452DRAFT_289505 [Aplosporella prunicola CBS 121167]KAF2139492.1 hypothetical protein K452DRAFT_289505 [Aplosporella prunicola CBS 121167]
MSTYQQGRTRGRGGWRGTSSRGFFADHPTFSSNRADRGRPQQQSSESTPRTPSPPLGPILKTIIGNDLEDIPYSNYLDCKISNCEYVGSYNWLNRSNPTIKVPGRPPVWKPLDKPKTLAEDNGTYFRDLNSARFPQYPIEPAIRALLTTNPTFLSADIDVFGCSSTIGNLLRFVRGIDKPFRFLVEVVGDTVFFIRRENSPTETIPDVRGFGHTFPENYTEWKVDVSGSETHQRLIRYNFGGLQFVVRFEADGYFDNLASPEGTTSTPATPGQKESDGFSLSDALHQSSMSHRPSSSNALLSLEQGGTEIPQEAIFDLKTRSIRRKDVDVVSDEIGRLWVSQIPNMILAYHERGFFKKEEIHIHDVRHKVTEWEDQNQKVLGQLAILIRKITHIAKSNGDGKLEIRRKEADILEIRKQKEGAASAMSPETKEIWEGEGSDVGGNLVDLHEKDDGYDEDYVFESRYSYTHYSDESEPDYTACSADDCGYCGHCSY